MSKIAIIGGDDRVLQVDWGPDVKAYTGDDSGRLVKAAREGSFRGVIALSKWMHGQLKNGLRSLPPKLKVVYWPNSINSLEGELDSLVERNFPDETPAKPESWVQPRQLPFNPVIQEVQMPQVAAKALPAPPVYIGPDGTPLLPRTLASLLTGPASMHDINLWTREEQEILILARDEAEKQLYPDGLPDGKRVYGLGEVLKKIFVELGGNPKRSVGLLRERSNKIAMHEERRRAAEERSKAAKRAAVTRAANKAAVVATEEPAVATPEVPPTYTNGHDFPIKPASPRADALIRILSHVREGVALGISTKAQAYDDICKHLDRLLASEAP